MRRAQVDKGSQPNRNAFTNPSFESTSVALTIRMNLVLNPRMTNSNFGGYGSQTLANVSGYAPNDPFGINSAVRVSYSAGAPNAGVVVMQLPEINTRYTFSAYVLNEGTTAENIALALKGAVSGGQQVVEPGAWVRLSWTLTTPGALGPGNDFGVRIASPSASGSFLTTAVLVEKSPALGTYFDGYNPAAGDFTHMWAGPANASFSYVRGVAVASSFGGNVDPVSSTAWFTHGTRSLRIIPNSNTASTDSFATAGGDTGVMRLGMVEGGTYTAAATFRQDAVLTGNLRALSPCISVFYRQASGVYASRSSPAKANAIGVERLSVTFTLPLGVTEAFIRLYHGGQKGAGDVWVSDFIFTEGEYKGDYIDGTSLLSKWDGDPHTSTSVGYPPQLYDIAGKPAIDIVGVGNSGGVAIPVGPFVGRTFYVVYESMGITGNYNSAFYYGVAGTKGFMLQTAGSGSINMANRMDAPGGTVNGAVVHGLARVVAKRHVAAFAFNEGMTSVTSFANGAADQTGAFNPGTGWDDGRVSTLSNSELKPLRSLVYYGTHDRTTRLAISRYLGNKYGAYVA